MLSAHDLSYSYGSLPVFSGLNLELHPAEILGVTGPSGSGKSTLGAVLAGWQQPASGTILIDDHEPPARGFHPVQLIRQHPERAIDPYLRLSYVVEGLAPELLDQLQINREWLNRRAGELSGGQLQRLNIARALHPKTTYVIADEITTMLDAITQAELWRTLVAVARQRGLGMLVISHDHDLLSHIADRRVRLEDLQ